MMKPAFPPKRDSQFFLKRDLKSHEVPLVFKK